MRADRIIALLRIFEALRLKAASHEGKLPDSLAGITEVPIPNDPVTGKAFEYERSSDHAMLRYVPGPNAGEPLEYEISVASDK
jgi:hypothetical protein